MLKRKQYFITLFIAVMMFFTVFIVSYYLVKDTPKRQTAVESQIAGADEESIDVLADTESEKLETIQPDTRIHVMVFDDTSHLIDDKELDPFSLLGLNEMELREKFKGYSLVEFSKERVELKKVLTAEEEEGEYILGLQDEEVCIIEKENGSIKRIMPLGISINRFSRSTYSLLLKEQIVLSMQQKNELLANPEYIEQILQSYEQE